MEYKPRRKLTREFKLEAVRQAALSEKPKAQLARELGVRVGQLRTWRLEFEKEAVSGIAKADRSAVADLEQLGVLGERRLNRQRAGLIADFRDFFVRRPRSQFGERSGHRLRIVPTKPSREGMPHARTCGTSLKSAMLLLVRSSLRQLRISPFRAGDRTSAPQRIGRCSHNLA